mmetsp:Transcript_27285/g.45150  ORF Transcript_27285/g.45150 Transcript_27285/m.45150 type:complete len:84 (+) Transcript_27285:32-283(+)
MMKPTKHEQKFQRRITMSAIPAFHVLSPRSYSHCPLGCGDLLELLRLFTWERPNLRRGEGPVPDDLGGFPVFANTAVLLVSLL